MSAKSMITALAAGLQPTTKWAGTVDSRGSGGWVHIFESFAGAWQSNHVTIDSPRDVLAFPGVYASVTKIAGDIAKMRPKLVIDNADGTCTEVAGNSPFRAVLERPNHYQNRIKFVQGWVVSKLLHGNAYALKQREPERRMVTRVYLLDPQRVTPLITEGGDVYYQIAADQLSRLGAQVVVPASEIMHDLMCPLWHPLVGVSPLYAGGMAATMGNRIIRNSAHFFGNMSRPSGYLKTPGKLDEGDAATLKRLWEENFGGANVGRTAVLANGLDYTPMATNAHDSQLTEQKMAAIEDVARCFGIPIYKIGGPVPANTTVEALNQSYYSECLQILIEDFELCFGEGIGLPRGMYVELDLDALMRMDTAAMVKTEAEAVKGGIKSPDEARRRMNLAPVPGGKHPYLQQQNYSLEALAKRDAQDDPFKSAAPAPAAAPVAPAANDEESEERAAQRFMEALAKGFDAAEVKS